MLQSSQDGQRRDVGDRIVTKVQRDQTDAVAQRRQIADLVVPQAQPVQVDAVLQAGKVADTTVACVKPSQALQVRDADVLRRYAQLIGDGLPEVRVRDQVAGCEVGSHQQVAGDVERDGRPIAAPVAGTCAGADTRGQATEAHKQPARIRRGLDGYQFAVVVLRLVGRLGDRSAVGRTGFDVQGIGLRAGNPWLGKDGNSHH